MDKAQLEKLYRERDRAVRVLSKNGKFRAVGIKNTISALTAQKRHNLPYLAAFLMARTMSAASSLAMFLKGDERIVVEAEGNGPISRVLAEAIQVGEVRGFVNLAADANDRKINDLSDALGLGLFKVTRYIYNNNEPVQGVIPLQGGDIASDLSYYYHQSEQIPSAVILDVTFDEEGWIKQSGGIIVQSMPGATDEDNQMLYEALIKIQSLSDYFEKGMTPLDMMKEILPFEFELVKSSQIDFYCRCSKENFLGKLKTIGLEEIQDMKKVGDNELTCHYCNEKYTIEEDDFAKLIAELQATQN
jgi:molecular chaperone Hsp33